MGEAKIEISRIEKARDHPPDRAIPPAGLVDPGQAGHCENDLLKVVRLLPGFRRGRPYGSGQRPRPSLEPYPVQRSPVDRRACPAGTGTFALGTGRWVHRHETLFRLRSFRLSNPKGP